MTYSSLTDDQYITEAVRLVEQMKKEGIPLRVMAGCAVRIHCPAYGELHQRQLERNVRDIDLTTLRKHSKRLALSFSEFGYGVQVAKFGLDRDIYENPSKKIQLDVFFDRLEMCHRIELADRLENDYPTITLADLVLQKLQIVEINERDLKDILVLFVEHEVGDIDKETINGSYIAKVLSKDWGFYYTVTENIRKSTKIIAERYGKMLSPQEIQLFRDRTGHLQSLIEAHPKTFAWKMRERVGTKKVWYNEVEEKERGTLAEYLNKKHEQESAKL